jgi:ABC-3C protein
MSEQPGGASRFSAAGPTLGYLAQVDYALWATLERMDAEESFSVSIETLDDIVFHDSETDDATEKWQSKHSIDGSRSLSDASSDLWKTLYNWIVEPSDAGVRLVLLATARAGTAAGKLRVGADRDVVGAMAALERTARESQSETNKFYYEAFLGLSPENRRALLDRVDVIDEMADVASLTDDLMRAVRKSVVPRRRAALVERLRGWWHARAIAHLDAVANGRADRISAEELEERLLAIADTLRDENLPIDVLDFPRPSEQEVSEDDRIFVAQLRLIAMGSQRMRKCIYDHNRAFAQRSLWQRDRLLEVGELGRYDAELIEAWERFFVPLSDSPGEEITEEELKAAALTAFGEFDQSDLAPIRRDVRSGFIARGSLHVIADRLEIGWHPKWIEHLQHRLAEARDTGERAA